MEEAGAEPPREGWSDPPLNILERVLLHGGGDGRTIARASAVRPHPPLQLSSC